MVENIFYALAFEKFPFKLRSKQKTTTNKKTSFRLAGVGVVLGSGRLVLIPPAGSDRLLASSKPCGGHGGGKHLLCLSF